MSSEGGAKNKTGRNEKRNYLTKKCDLFSISSFLKTQSSLLLLNSLSGTRILSIDYLSTIE